MQTVVNNNNIQERLQVLHDYIQRTIDALNDLSSSTRQVVQGLGLTTQRTDGTVGVHGINHTAYNQWTAPYGFVQTPYGVPFVQGVTPNMNMVPYGTMPGLHHTTHGVPYPQTFPQAVGVPSFNYVQTPYGLMPVPVTNNWATQNWTNQNGLNHSGFAPTQQGWMNVPGYGTYGTPGFGTPVGNTGNWNHGWVNPMTANMGWGLNHSSFAPTQYVPMGWANQQSPIVGATQNVVGQPVVGSNQTVI